MTKNNLTFYAIVLFLISCSGDNHESFNDENIALLGLGANHLILPLLSGEFKETLHGIEAGEVIEIEPSKGLFHGPYIVAKFYDKLTIDDPVNINPDGLLYIKKFNRSVRVAFERESLKNFISSDNLQEYFERLSLSADVLSRGNDYIITIKENKNGKGYIAIASLLIKGVLYHVECWTGNKAENEYSWCRDFLKEYTNKFIEYNKNKTHFDYLRIKDEFLAK